MKNEEKVETVKCGNCPKEIVADERKVPPLALIQARFDRLAMKAGDDPTPVTLEQVATFGVCSECAHLGEQGGLRFHRIEATKWLIEQRDQNLSEQETIRQLRAKNMAKYLDMFVSPTRPREALEPAKVIGRIGDPIEPSTPRGKKRGAA